MTNEVIINKIKRDLSERVILFSDIHIGKKSNSTNYHKTCLDYSNWLKNQAIENNIDTLLFLGDFFHDREEINLTSLHVADQFLNNLKEFKIVLIVGNHDCYYKNNAQIHSLSIFKKWDNITVIDETTVFDYLDKKIAFLPWGFQCEDIPKGVDYGFGHLEIESFKINKVKMCEKNAQSVSSSSLLKKVNSVFSGHFHLRSKKEYKSGQISYIGNTFEQDWADFEDQKGIEIFNFTTGETKFIKNDFSPKHIKIHLSKLISKDNDELELVKNHFKNNYTKLIIDEEIEPDKLFAISSKLSNLKPLDFNSEIITCNSNKSADEFDSVEIEMKTLLTEFINSLEIDKNKNRILEKSLQFYEEATKEISFNNE
jgi:DNA repair exonuclease SbcCD nuclease subunit